MNTKQQNDKNYRIIIFVFTLILLLVGVVLCFQGKAASAASTYGAAIICLIFVFLPAFKRFKGLGVEAELLDRKIEEAETILSCLREISLPTAELTFANLSRVGWLRGPIPKSEQYRLRKEIKEGLKQIGISEDKMLYVEREWHNWNLVKLATPLGKIPAGILDQKIKDTDVKLKKFKGTVRSEDLESHNAIVQERRLFEDERKMLSSIMNSFEGDQIADKFSFFIENTRALSDQERKKIFSVSSPIIDDLKFYAKHRDFRRPEEWFKNDNWEEH